MSKDMFERFFPFVEVRADEEAGKLIIEGHAAVFDVESRAIGGYFHEVVRRGAFDRTLKDADQVMLWSHDPAQPLGRRSAGTLSMSEDNKGLYFRAEMGDTTWGRNAYTAIKRGDVRGMSFGFRPVKVAWENREKPKLLLRELLDVDLIEVSPTAFPAYDVDGVQARSLVPAEYLGIPHPNPLPGGEGTGQGADGGGEGKEETRESDQAAAVAVCAHRARGLRLREFELAV